MGRVQARLGVGRESDQGRGTGAIWAVQGLGRAAIACGWGGEQARPRRREGEA